MHRNIKPNNIFLNSIEQGHSEDHKVKLGGFDCAINIKDNTSEPVGSLFYSAPEIIKNLYYDEKCDLWSFGITLYEILFGYLPFGKSLTPSLIKEIILYEDNFYYKKTSIQKLDFLFDKLLTINRKNRINHNDFFYYISNSGDMFQNVKETIEEVIGKKWCKCTSICSHSFPVERIKRKIITLDEDFPLKDYKTKDFVINKIMNIIEGEHLPNIMNFQIIDNIKYNNIIYYDENLNFIKSIYKDSDTLERFTPGAFLLCTNIKSLELIKPEIIRQFNKDKRTYFNLITTGSKCEKVLDFINKDYEFEKCIKNICIFCMKIEKYKYLKTKYKKINDDIYNKIKDVINFIKKSSNMKIKPYSITKLITYQD